MPGLDIDKPEDWKTQIQDDPMDQSDPMDTEEEEEEETVDPKPESEDKTLSITNEIKEIYSDYTKIANKEFKSKEEIEQVNQYKKTLLEKKAELEAIKSPPPVRNKEYTQYLKAAEDFLEEIGVASTPEIEDINSQLETLDEEFESLADEEFDLRTQIQKTKNPRQKERLEKVLLDLDRRIQENEEKSEALEDRVKELQTGNAVKIIDSLKKRHQHLEEPIRDYVENQLSRNNVGTYTKEVDDLKDIYQVLGLDPKHAKKMVKNFQIDNTYNDYNLEEKGYPRSAYNTKTKKVRIRGYDTDNDVVLRTSIFHEISHVFQSTYKTEEAETAWAFSKSKTKKIVPLYVLLKVNERYDEAKQEYAIDGDFHHPYVGRVYPDDPKNPKKWYAKEVLTTALQTFADPESLRDYLTEAPDQIKLVLGIIANA